MMSASVLRVNPKKAEFARLFDLFDRVATRRTRALTGDTSEVISADDIANVPAEFAPVLENLSMILSLRARRDENSNHARHAQAASTTKPRHSTGTSTGAPSTLRTDEAKTDVKNPSFPLGQRYPFTFKLMLHKLYDLDEWAEKVKHAVETSKSQFKPLAERVQTVVRDTTTTGTTGIKERAGPGEKRNNARRPALGASAKFKPPSMTQQVHPRQAVTSGDATPSVRENGEKRNSLSVRPVLGASAKFKPPPTRSSARHPHPNLKPTELESRVLKKRCIGRRKSIGGPTSTGVWVYAAAISATVTEVAGRRPAVEITLSAPRDAGSVAEDRARHRSLNALEDTHSRGTTRRRVKITIPLPREEDAELALALQVSQEVIAMKSVERKKSLASVFPSETCKRVVAKRPLCV